MSYAPQTDFLALLRQTSGGARLTRMPGLDYVAEALGRAGMIVPWISQTAPPSTTDVWVKPAIPSWFAECQILLWSVSVAAWLPATPALWASYFSPTTLYKFQSVAVGAAVIGDGTTLLAIRRAAPVLTTLQLPAVANQQPTELRIVDWSTAVTGHTIQLVPNGAETVMQQNTWSMLSSADQLGSLTLYASIDLNGWVIE